MENDVNVLVGNILSHGGKCNLMVVNNDIAKAALMNTLCANHNATHLILTNLVDVPRVYKVWKEKIKGNKQLESTILEGLMQMIPTLNSFFVNGNEDKLATNGSCSGVVKSLTSFGDIATNRLFRILLALATNKNGIVFIDNIETGINFRLMLGFWKAIISTAKSLNVRLFATTQSQECIYYFRKALEKDNQKEDSKLIVIKSNKFRVRFYDYEGLVYAYENDREIR